jgi:hypothetical protein
MADFQNTNNFIDITLQYDDKLLMPFTCNMFDAAMLFIDTPTQLYY